MFDERRASAIYDLGELAGYWLVYQRFGSGRVAWRDLIRPSIDLARRGVAITEYLADVLVVKENHFRELPTMQ